MTREQAKQLLPIIAAFADGKQIQIKSGTSWQDASDIIGFGLNPESYRMKPEPREWFLEPNSHTYDGFYVRAENRGNDCIRVREILED
jgi:hypothetical protein